MWRKFVPDQHEMTSSNCWYAQNINPFPKRVTEKMEHMDTFVNIQSQFPKAELEYILSHVFKSGNKTAFSLSHSDHYFCLPSTFLIGFPKSGTTLLYKYIENHPMMTKPHNKEGQFWREFFATKAIIYQELHTLLYLFHFRSASKAIQYHPQMFTVDASASTVFATPQSYAGIENGVCVVPTLLFQALPKSKLLIIMRNPIDRLWSDFWYFCSLSKWKGKVNHEISVPEYILPIASELFHNLTVLAIQDFVNCMNSNHTQLYCVTFAGSISGEEAGCERLRLSLSLYYSHIVRWFSVFPQKQILLLRLEDLIANSLSTMSKVWSFLDVTNIGTRLKFKVNGNSWIRSKKNSMYFKMWQKTRDLLSNFFHPYNNMLAELLNDHQYLWND